MRTTPARVLIAEPLLHGAVVALKQAGFDVVHNPHLTESSLTAAVRDLEPDVLVVRGIPVTEATLLASKHLSLVVHAGSGAEGIDIAAASRRGTLVAHCPARGAAAVAELAFGLILTCDRRIPEQVAATRAGSFDHTKFLDAHGLHGRSLGIIGLGLVGQEVAKRGRSFGMHVLAWSPNITEQRCDILGIDLCSNLVNLAKLSDVVSVSVTGNEQTHHLLGPKFLQAMRPGAILVNTSQGSVIDEAALLAAVKQAGIRVGLDSFGERSASPLTAELLAQSAVYGTQCTGAITEQASAAVAEDAVRIVRAWSEEGRAPNCLNVASSTHASALLTLRHENCPGVLARVFELLGGAEINIEEMDNTICAGGQAAVARIHLSHAPDAALTAAVRAIPHVFSATVAQLNP